jgi:MFS family permease
MGTGAAYKILGIRDFRLFFLARFFVQTGLSMQAAVVGWQVAQLTHDPLSLGLIGLAEVIPFVGFVLFGGHAADIYSRKRLILYSLAVYSACCAALLLFSTGATGLVSKAGTLPIYCVIFLTGIARALLAPSQIALMAQIVPREQYASSAAWNSMAFHVAVVGGPAIGGLICGYFSIASAYAVVCMLLAIGFFHFLSISQQGVPDRREKEPLLTSLAGGLRFVFGNQVIVGSMALDMFAVLFGGAVAMLPLFADQILHVGAQGYGILRASPAAGSVIMSVILSTHPPLKKSGLKFMACTAGFGACMIVFALSKSLWLSALVLALSGMLDNMGVVVRTTIIQLYAPDDMRGRIGAVNSIFISSSNELGAFESGVAARLMGLVPSVIFGGAMTLVVVGVTARLAPLLRKLELGDKIKAG